jgi:hypothetical protein
VPAWRGEGEGGQGKWWCGISTAGERGVVVGLPVLAESLLLPGGVDHEVGDVVPTRVPEHRVRTATHRGTGSMDFAQHLSD